MKGDDSLLTGSGRDLDGTVVAFAELLPVEPALCVQAAVAGCRELARHPRPPERERPRKPWNIYQNNIIANEP